VENTVQASVSLWTTFGDIQFWGRAGWRAGGRRIETATRAAGGLFAGAEQTGRVDWITQPDSWLPDCLLARKTKESKRCSRLAG